MKDKISVIVPIYNVAPFLRECIDSIINQEYNNIEIILVNDGSTDGSAEICNEYSFIDERIKVFHKENGGLSDARNFGINNSSGKYITFIDSDDYIAIDFLSSLYNNLKENNVKISAIGYCYVFPNNEVEYNNFRNIHKLYSEEEAQIYLNSVGYFNVAAWNKLYVRELFDDIKFPVGKKSEDWFIMYKLIEKADGIYYSSDEKYFYRQRKGSITKSGNINVDVIDAATEVYEYFKAKHRVNVIPFAAQSLAFALIGVYNTKLCAKDKKKDLFKYRKQVLRIKDEITYDKLSKSRKIQLALFIYCRWGYDVLFKIFNYKRNKKYI